MNSTYQPIKTHESIIVFSGSASSYSSKGSMIYNPQFSKGIPYTATRSRQGRYKFNTSPDKKLTTVNNGNFYPTSIISISNSNYKMRGKLHPTQKPLALLQYLIRTYTNPNDLILDNTIGSGTTLLAAQNEGRQAVGIEIDEDYCAIAVERLRQPSFFSIPNRAAKLVGVQVGLW